MQCFYDFERPWKILAPMVNNSDIAYRILARKNGADFCYTEMVHSKLFLETRADPIVNRWYTTMRNNLSEKIFTKQYKNSIRRNLESSQVAINKIENYRQSNIHNSDFKIEQYLLKNHNKHIQQCLAYNFNTNFGDEIYVCRCDYPLVVQICGNDPIIMLEAAKRIQPHCEAIDINFGCPQDIAKRGFYGSYLQNDLELTKNIVSTLSYGLEKPLFCKVRIFDKLNDTINYVKMIENAGASLLAIHGRTRNMRGVNTGFADWNVIKKCVETVSIPVIGNGNIVQYKNIKEMVDFCRVDGVMIAEPHLYNPLIFQEKQKNNYNEELNISYLQKLDISSNHETVGDFYYKGIKVLGKNNFFVSDLLPDDPLKLVENEDTNKNLQQESIIKSNIDLSYNEIGNNKNILSSITSNELDNDPFFKKIENNTDEFEPQCNLVLSYKQETTSHNDYSDLDKIQEYLNLCKIYETKHAQIRSHMFKFLYSVLDNDMRQKISRMNTIEEIETFLNQIRESDKIVKFQPKLRGTGLRDSFEIIDEKLSNLNNDN